MRLQRWERKPASTWAVRIVGLGITWTTPGFRSRAEAEDWARRNYADGDGELRIVEVPR